LRETEVILHHLGTIGFENWFEIVVPFKKKLKVKGGALMRITLTERASRIDARCDSNLNGCAR
jgi:hypothetical protein